MLWRALVGTHPYIEQCPPDRALASWVPERVRANARRGVAEAAPMAPAGLCAAIERLLQPVATRTRSAEDVIAALDPFVRHDSASALGRLAAATAREAPPVGRSE